MYGISARNGSITINGGTVTAISEEYLGAVNKQPTLTGSAGYTATYSTNDSGQPATTTTSYTWESTHKYLRIVMNVPVTVSPNAAFTQGSAPQLTVLIGAELADFNATGSYDGVYSTSELTPKLGTVGAPGADGEVENGSIKITLYPRYLNTLTPGTYWLRFALTGMGYPAYAETRITVTAPDVPETGDSAHPLLWAGLTLLAGAGLVLLRRRWQA